MKLVVVMAALFASVASFPAPDPDPSPRAIRRSANLGDLNNFNAARAASNGFWNSFSGSKFLSGVITNVTVHVTASSEQLLDSLTGSIESQLSQLVNSLSSDVERELANLPVRFTNRTSRVVVKIVNLGKDYLNKFGYMSKKSRSKLAEIVDPKTMKRSIRTFQQMAGIEASGQLNAETVRMMSMSRCGVEDTVGAFNMGNTGNQADSKYRSKKRQRMARRKKRGRKGRKATNAKSRGKRYNAEGGLWATTNLKYWINDTKITKDMTKAQIYHSIQKAWEVWTNVTKLKVRRVSSPSRANLKISFGSGDHGDDYPFDGKGGTLAHAFFPSDGRAHFDDAERYTFKGNEGVNLFIVAAHEFGHSLGLGHSSVRNSLMAPFYQGYVENFKLHDDDIAGIQQLYGKPDSSRKVNTNEKKTRPKKKPTQRPNIPTTTSPPRPGAMDVCGERISFDATVYDHTKDVMYGLRGAYYWKINDRGVVAGYPRKIVRYWKGLPPNINAAAYSKYTQRFYFFKGNRMWRYTANRTLESGFPRSVSDLGLPSHPQAAVQWSGDGNIYIFKDGFYYRFSEYQRYDGTRRFRRLRTSAHWNNIPDQPNAAIQWKNGKTYFFKGDEYWRFSDTDSMPDKNYPKSVKKMWIGCGKSKASAAKLKQKRPILARLQSQPTEVTRND